MRQAVEARQQIETGACGSRRLAALFVMYTKNEQVIKLLVIGFLLCGVPKD
jgi:hypothetical protein